MSSFSNVVPKAIDSRQSIPVAGPFIFSTAVVLITTIELTAGIAGKVLFAPPALVTGNGWLKDKSKKSGDHIVGGGIEMALSLVNIVTIGLFKHGTNKAIGSAGL